MPSSNLTCACLGSEASLACSSKAAIALVFNSKSFLITSSSAAGAATGAGTKGVLLTLTFSVVSNKTRPLPGSVNTCLVLVLTYKSKAKALKKTCLFPSGEFELSRGGCDHGDGERSRWVRLVFF